MMEFRVLSTRLYGFARRDAVRDSWSRRNWPSLGMIVEQVVGVIDKREYGVVEVSKLEGGCSRLVDRVLCRCGEGVREGRMDEAARRVVDLVPYWCLGGLEKGLGATDAGTKGRRSGGEPGVEGAGGGCEVAGGK